MKKKININNATLDELMAPKGIGAKSAQFIFDYRKEKGNIYSLSELKSTGKFNNSIFQKIEQNFFVEEKKIPSEINQDSINIEQSIKDKADQSKKRIKSKGKRQTDRTTDHSNKEEGTHCVLEILNEEILIFGTPENLSCNLTIKNHGDTIYNFIPIAFHSYDKSIKQDSLKNLRIRSRLYPNQEKKYELTIDSVHCIPPGEYRLKMKCDELERDVILCVEEFHSIDIRPNDFYIHCTPGEVLSKNVFITNNGNTTVNFQQPGFIFLSDRFAHCRVLKSAARKIKEPIELSQLAYLAASEIDSLYRETSSLIVSISDSKSIDIPPNATQKVSLEIRIPKTLKSPNIYKGRYRFYNSSIAFDIIPTSSKEIVT